MTLPLLRLKKGQDRRINAGHPWIYSNEIENTAQLALIPPGSLVNIVNNFGNFLATAYCNRHSLITARVLSKEEGRLELIDVNFFIHKINQALKLRQDFFDQPYYRLIHSEADGLPGLVMDRFDDIFVLQITTQAMENWLELILQAINTTFTNATIVLRNDTDARKMENLELYVKVVQGSPLGGASRCDSTTMGVEGSPLGGASRCDSTTMGENKTTVTENNLKFYFDVLQGQKTGWFFDQRNNRRFIAEIAKGKDVLDCYCYNGGFGINAANAGAKSVTFVDSSELAIKNVESNIKLNNLSGDFSYINDKVFDCLESLSQVGTKFDLVVLDPPAFVKSKKDFFSGLKGYEKLTKLAGKLVAKNGYLFIASCSHNVSLEDLIRSAGTGIEKSGRNSKIIRMFGAGIDHPLHPFLKESEYLKSITYQLD